MSGYTYPTNLVPTATDATALTTLLAQRQSSANSPTATPPNAGVTNGGIVADGVPAVPDLTTNQSSAAYLGAMADAFLYRLGFISQNEAICTGSSTSFNTSASFANFPNMPTASITVPLDGLYMVHLDMVGFWQATGTFGIAFRVTNTTNSANGASLSWNWYPSSISQRVPRFSARTPLRMQVGANIIQVQAKMLNAGETLGQDTSTVRAITVTA